MTIASLVFLALIPGSEVPKAESYPQAQLLIEPAGLSKLKSDQVRILDARGKGKYLEGHVPGAVWVDAVTWAKAFTKDQEPEKWGKMAGDLGLVGSTPIVIYDDSMAKDAARIWWILRYWGFKDVRLLNGGWKGWVEAKGNADTEVPAITPTKPALKPETTRLATKGQMLDSIRSKALQIVDARSSGEFCGSEETAKRNGAIPSAIHQEWSDALDKKTQRFKKPEDLAKLFKDNQIDLTKPTVTYCQSGGRAAVMAFTLELMGVKDVRNYYRSWSEWGNAEDTPIVRPEKKE